MSSEDVIEVDNPGVQYALGNVTSELEEIENDLDGEDDDDTGLDPAASAAVRGQNDDAKNRLNKAKRTARTGRRGADDLEDTAENDADTTNGTDTSGADDPLGQLAKALGGASQSALNPLMSSMSAQQVNPYANGYIPTPATATQYDLANAPNRAELSAAIMEAARTGDYGTGAPGDTRARQGGGTVNVNATDERDRAFQELADKLLASEPPIPYAWGGGHGGEPGPSQGISDGGGQADKMGDYNKIGLDCSGLARLMVYEVTGQDSANGTAETQYNTGQPVSPDEARPGDLVFPDSSGRPPMHVQVYLGDGKVCEMQQSGTVMMVSDCPPAEFRRF